MGHLPPGAGPPAGRCARVSCGLWAERGWGLAVHGAHLACAGTQACPGCGGGCCDPPHACEPWSPRSAVPAHLSQCPGGRHRGRRVCPCGGHQRPHTVGLPEPSRGPCGEDPWVPQICSCSPCHHSDPRRWHRVARPPLVQHLAGSGGAWRVYLHLRAVRVPEGRGPDARAPRAWPRARLPPSCCPALLITDPETGHTGSEGGHRLPCRLPLHGSDISMDQVLHRSHCLRGRDPRALRGGTHRPEDGRHPMPCLPCFDPPQTQTQEPGLSFPPPGPTHRARPSLRGQGRLGISPARAGQSSVPLAWSLLVPGPHATRSSLPEPRMESREAPAEIPTMSLPDRGLCR